MSLMIEFSDEELYLIDEMIRDVLENGTSLVLIKKYIKILAKIEKQFEENDINM